MEEDQTLTIEEETTEDSDSSTYNKKYCANCIHCKLVRVPTGDGKQYQLRVKCTAHKWKKKLGKEKFHKYFSVARRVQEDCDSYESMSDDIKDSRDYLKSLKKSLPIRDEVYQIDKK